MDALHDAAGGNPWALLVVVCGVCVFMLDRVAHWVDKLRNDVRRQEAANRGNEQMCETMADIHRTTQATTLIQEKHLDRLESLDRNVERTMDGVQRVEDMVKGMT